MAGGTNSLELLWAIVALIAAGSAMAAMTVAWLALSIEGYLTGSPWPYRLLDMPGVLGSLLTDQQHPALVASVAMPWRLLTIAGVLTLLATVALVRGLRVWFDWRDGWRHRQRVHDRIASRVWARRRELTGLLEAPPRRHGAEPACGGRLLVGSFDGADVCVPARTSVMAIAPTRTGKTSRLVVPNLLRWDGPALVTSVKRDVYDLTATRRTRFGPVHLFDPTGSTGLSSVRWSPLLSATTFPDATKTATWLTDAAAVEDKHEAAKFWETLATKLLAPMLYAAAVTGRTMNEVSHWVDRAAFDEVADILATLSDDDACAAWDAIRGLPHETRGSVLGTAMAIFRAFGSPRVRDATSCTPGDTDNTLAVAQMFHDNATLYLVAPEYEQAELRPLFVALVQAVYRAGIDLSANLLAGAPLNPPLLMMLDEAGNIAPLKALPKIAATGAGQGITLMTIWQDRAQIRQLYGDAERTVIANHSTSIWLPGSQDLDTLKLLAELIGDQWVASSTISAAPDGGLSVSEGSERIDVAPPAFLRTLPHGRAVMLTGNHPPALITTHAYYQHARWRRLVGRDLLDQHDAIHRDAGPLTAERWDAQGFTDPLPSPAPLPADAPTRQTDDAAATATANEHTPGHGPAGRSILCDRYERENWGPAGEAIPDQLDLHDRAWTVVALPHPICSVFGPDADFTDPDIRRHVLPMWLETGPRDQLAATVTFPQLHAEWPHLELADPLRDAWEACFPDLAANLRPHPASRRDTTS